MKYLFTLLALSSLYANAQTAVPQLVNLGKDTALTMPVELSSNGYTIAYQYYEYCTNGICFNDGMHITVYDGTGNLSTKISFEKPANNTSVSSKFFMHDAVVDKNNDIVMVGTFHSDIDFDPNGTAAVIKTGTTIASNASNLFIAKYGITDGKLKWLKVLTDVNSTQFSYTMCSFMQLATDNSGNIYLATVNANGTFDINPGTPVVAVTGDFFAKYNSSGDYILHKTGETISNSYYRSLRFINNGLYLLTTNDSVGKKTFAMKQYDLNTLNTIRSKRFGWFTEDNASTGRRKRIDYEFNQGDLWVMGDFINTMNMPATNGPLNETLVGSLRGFFIAKLDASWNVTDAKLLQKTNFQYYSPVKIGFDSSNHLLVVGSFMDSLDADMSAANYWIKPVGTNYKTNGYMLYYDNNLNFSWAKTFGDTANLIVIYANFGKNKEIYVTGNFKGKANFSVEATPVYHTPVIYPNNMYYAKYNWPTSGAATAIPGLENKLSSLTVYPNPANKNVFITAEQNIDELTVTDAAGKLVYRSTPHQKTVSVEMNTAGIYFISVVAKGERIIRKLVVN